MRGVAGVIQLLIGGYGLISVEAAQPGCMNMAALICTLTAMKSKTRSKMSAPGMPGALSHGATILNVMVCAPAGASHVDQNSVMVCPV